MLYFKPPRLQSSPEFIPDPNEDINNTTPQPTLNSITSGSLVEDQAGVTKDDYQTVTPQVAGNIDEQVAPSGSAIVRDELPVNIVKDTNAVPVLAPVINTGEAVSETVEDDVKDLSEDIDEEIVKVN